VVALLVVLACGDASASAGSEAPRVAVSWTRNTDGAGVVLGLQGEAPWLATTAPLVVGADPLLRSTQDTLYVLSRNTGDLTLVDVPSWTATATISLGANAQPVDIAVIDGRRAYVTRASTSQLLRLDPRSGVSFDVLDLAAFADSDGNPDMGTMAVHEGRLFIQLRRRDDNGLPSRPLLAVVDLATETLVDADPMMPGTQCIALLGTAPKGKMQVDATTRRLIVSATGSLHDAGGIELIDLDAFTSLGFAVDEGAQNAGADVGAFVMTTSSFGYFSFSTDFAPSSHLHTFTFPNSGDFGPELQTTLLYVVPHILHDPVTDLLFWPEGGQVAPGVLVFDAATGARLTTQPVPTTGNPTDLELLCGESCGSVAVEKSSWSRLKKRFR
jgi:hypothetical protein